MSRPELDVDALYAALDQKRRSKGLSWRQVATEVGIASSTFSRMTQNKRPDVDSFAALVGWLGMPAETFLRTDAPKGEADVGETLAVISTHLKASKDMSPETVDALRDLLGAVGRLMDSRKGK